MRMEWGGQTNHVQNSQSLIIPLILYQSLLLDYSYFLTTASICNATNILTKLPKLSPNNSVNKTIFIEKYEEVGMEEDDEGNNMYYNCSMNWMIFHSSEFTHSLLLICCEWMKGGRNVKSLMHVKNRHFYATPYHCSYSQYNNSMQ